MIALTRLDFAYDAVTVVMWLILAALVVLALWFVYAFAEARRNDQRPEPARIDPSNITVLPYVRLFDFELDA